MNRVIKIELLWLLSLLIISVLIIGLVNGFDKLVAGNFHIQLYDTYYITNKYLISAGLFLIICHIAYLARQIIQRFSTTLPNLILLAVSGLLIIVISQFISQLSTMNLIKGGWVIYPPLSALPKDFEFETDSSMYYGLVVIQSWLVLTILIVGILTGKKLNK